MRKKILALLLGLSLLMQMIPIGYATEAQTIGVTDFTMASHLETVAQVVLYGGDTENVTYTDTATAGYQYLIVQADLTVPLGDVVDLDSLYVQIGQAVYGRLVSDSFLGNHNYATMRHGDTSIDTSGALVFQIPTTYTQADLLADGALVTADGARGTFQTATSGDTNVITQTTYDSYVSRQTQLTQVYLTTASSGDYTAENPYIIVNPYEIAPLAAIVIFETEQPAIVTSSIVGKTEAATMTNTIDEAKTYHEIPLIGLYEGQNTVELTVSTEAGTETYTHSIITQAFSGLPHVTMVTQDMTQLSEGLYMMKDPYRTLIDVNGDIRGYFKIYTGASTLDEVDDQGRIWTATNAYSLYSTIYAFDYTGFIYKEIALNGIHPHHDGYLIDDSTMLLVAGALDLETSTYASYSRSWEYIFNSTQGSFEVRDNGSSDWYHFNTVTDGGDGTILVSMRNQHAVAKLTYPEMEVVWVLSANQEACLNDQDKYLTPVGDDFEWFYSQHDVSLVSENGDGTIDITIFDNGMQRGLDPDAEYPTDDLYSRMVTYRIDETAMTVEQLWEYGQELGTDGLSYVHGSAQYIPESDTYLGNFDTFSDFDTGGVVLPRSVTQIIEVNQAGEQVLAFNLDEACYRAEKLSYGTIYQPWQGLAESVGEFDYIINPLTNTATYPDFEATGTAQILGISAYDDFLDINGFVTGTIGGTVTARILRLVSQETGEAYYYTLGENTSQTKNSDVDSALRSGLSTSAGFYQRYLNLQDLEDGRYDIALMACEDGVYYLANTDYTLQIGQDIVPIATTGLVEQHNEKSAQLLEVYNNGAYTLDAPLVVLNPYDAAPLSALVAFNTAEYGTVTVEIPGKDDASTVTHQFSQVATSHLLPIYGLYADTANQVTITFTAQDGNLTEKTVTIQTEPLPSDFPVAHVTVANTDLMAEGFTYGIMEGGGSYGFDANGDVRWYTTTQISTMPIKRLANGNLISGSDTAVESEATAASLYEFDMLGRVHNEYLIYGAHHEVVELANGDLLVAASIGDTVEDYIVRLDRTTGEIVADWDMKEILSDMEHLSDEDWQLHIYNNQTINNPTATEEAKWTTVMRRSANDWFHNNALYYNEVENTILASGRMKDAIVKFDADTGEVIWILADPTADWAEAYADKLLTPIGDDFEYSYGNHAITVAEGGDILLFDNGNYRSKDMTTALEPNDTYSRGVRYAIDEENMTVTQVWQYGKELGSSAFSSYISDIDYLDTDHYLINFGGILTDVATGEAFNSTAMMKQEHVIDPQGITRVTELVDDEIVFEMHLSASDGTANTYRVERMTPYNTDESYVDLSLTAKRLGSLAPTTPVNLLVPEATNDLDYTVHSILDSGEDVYFDITVEGYDAYYLVLEGEAGTYVYDSDSIVKYGLPNGTYNVGILTVDDAVHYASIYRSMTVDIPVYPDHYVDVNGDNWFFSEVMSATYAGLFNGTDPGVFSPYEEMTVWMVELVLNRMSDGAYAISQELLDTISATAEDAISRQQLAAILYDYGQFMGLDMTQNTNILSFNDAFSIAEYGFEPLQWCNERGINQGTDENNLNPEGLANRSEVAAMLMRLRALFA